jgi:hypothetical protein
MLDSTHNISMLIPEYGTLLNLSGRTIRPRRVSRTPGFHPGPDACSRSATILSVMRV